MVPTIHYLGFFFIHLVVAPLSCYKLADGLYNSNDKIKILNSTNFDNEILNRNHSTFVEFYNTYCGHCRNFARTYKELAKELDDWSDILPFAALDCAVEENNAICRNYDILAYPTLEYFGPGYQPPNEGVHIKSQNKTILTSKLAQLLASENKTLNMSSWPDFLPVQTDSVSLLFEGLVTLKRYVVLVYEPENSTVGIEMILHFLRYPNIAVKRITDPDIAAKYQINETANKIATVSRFGEIKHYAPQNQLSSSYKETIKYFLTLKQITEKPETKPESTTTKISENSEEEKKTLEIVNEVKRNKHLVYQPDLEMAIHSVLRNEIPKASHINGDKLLALQKFLRVIDRYNPLGSSGRAFISRLTAFVTTHNENLSGDVFEEELKKLEQELGPIYLYRRLIGCTGSKSNLRGFTCSLWQLFHYMTVQAANSEKSQDPLEVLQAMHDYIKYFFGCTECSLHFLAMAARRNYLNTLNKDEAVLWLWEAHNEVNQRLSGDDTEDPEFPKIQFPSVSSCSECYKKPTDNLEDKWNKVNVLKFLKDIHNPKNISRYGLENDKHPKLEKLTPKRMVSNVFSEMDMRMGMLLYGFCIVMLVAAFKLFVCKGGYRKKTYGYMLGKV